MLLSQMREAVRSDVISPHIGNDMGLISGKDTVPGTRCVPGSITLPLRQGYASKRGWQEYASKP